MNLEFLKEERCSICGSPTISIIKERRHCNGHYNEYRKYECGRDLHHSPNFLGKIEELYECQQSQEFLLKKAKEKSRTARVISYMRKTMRLNDEEMRVIIGNLWRVSDETQARKGKKRN